MGGRVHIMMGIYQGILSASSPYNKLYDVNIHSLLLVVILNAFISSHEQTMALSGPALYDRICNSGAITEPDHQKNIALLMKDLAAMKPAPIEIFKPKGSPGKQQYVTWTPDAVAGLRPVSHLLCREAIKQPMPRICLHLTTTEVLLCDIVIIDEDLALIILNILFGS
jgi:hypothetical protein